MKSSLSASDPSVPTWTSICWHSIYMVCIYLLFSTEQGTALHLAFRFNTVYTQAKRNVVNLGKLGTIWQDFFSILPRISHHYWNPFWSAPSSISTCPKGHTNEALAPAQQEEPVPAFCNKDKVFSFNSKVTRTTVHDRKTVEEKKGIPRDC